MAEPNQFSEENYYAMVDSWICIEDETEVLNYVCEDEIEELNKNAKPAADNNTEDDDEPDLQTMDIDSGEPNFVSYVEPVEFLWKLQRSAPKLIVNAAATVNPGTSCWKCKETKENHHSPCVLAHKVPYSVGSSIRLKLILPLLTKVECYPRLILTGVDDS